VKKITEIRDDFIVVERKEKNSSLRGKQNNSQEERKENTVNSEEYRVERNLRAKVVDKNKAVGILIIFACSASHRVPSSDKPSGGGGAAPQGSVKGWWHESHVHLKLIFAVSHEGWTQEKIYVFE
jgi:hypothetical protein